MPSSPTPSNSPPSGWFAFVRGHFRQTRGPLAFGLCGAILLAPLLSLVKPVVGGNALAALAVGVAVLAAVLLIAYVAGATKQYIARLDRRLRDDETSGLAMLAWFCLWLAIGVGPISFAESRSPPTGWLVEFVPELHEEQVRWLGVAPRSALEPRAPDAVVASPAESREPPATLEPTEPANAKPASSIIASSKVSATATEAAASKGGPDTGNPFELEDEAAPSPAPAVPAKSVKPAPPSSTSKPDDQNPFETDP